MHGQAKEGLDEPKCLLLTIKSFLFWIFQLFALVHGVTQATQQPEWLNKEKFHDNPPTADYLKGKMFLASA